MLFMPAINQRAVNKAQSLTVDTVILDMEDSVHQDRKEEVREAVVSNLQNLDFGYREVLVRINATDTDYWREDIKALQSVSKLSRCDGIVVPKVETVEQIQLLADALADAETSASAESQLPLWIMIESPLAVINAVQLCGFGDPVAGMIIGTADLSKDLKMPHTASRFALMHALSTCMLAARAAGIVAIDGVFMDIKDQSGFEAEALQGVQLGFDGKTLIHPAQLEPCNRLFAPSTDEIDDATALIDAWEQARDQGAGVCTYKGKLVENLHVAQARERLQFHQLVLDRQQAGQVSPAAT